jgi:hypothetical protein
MMTSIVSVEAIIYIINGIYINIQFFLLLTIPYTFINGG